MGGIAVAADTGHFNPCGLDLKAVYAGSGVPRASAGIDISGSRCTADIVRSGQGAAMSNSAKCGGGCAQHQPLSSIGLLGAVDGNAEALGITGFAESGNGCDHACNVDLELGRAHADSAYQALCRPIAVICTGIVAANSYYCRRCGDGKASVCYAT